MTHAQTKFGAETANLVGTLPTVGDAAPEFVFTANDMTDKHLKDYFGKTVILNIFPSIDTRVCATSVREFNKRAAAVPNAVVLCISKDLPFAQKRFCGAEGIDKVETLSDYRGRGFGKDYGVELTNTTFNGLFARAIVVIGPAGKIRYTELVPQIG